MNALATARLRALAAQAGVGVLIEVGRRRGLFAALSSATTAAELASRSGVDAELARDWLDGLVLAHMVDHDGRHGTYTLLDDARAALALVDPFAAREDSVIPAASLGPAPLATLRALHATMTGASLSILELVSAERVADNMEHPLGAALYAASVTRREAGGAGVLGEARLRALMARAGFVDVEARPAGPLHVIVSGARKGTT